MSATETFFSPSQPTYSDSYTRGLQALASGLDPDALREGRVKGCELPWRDWLALFFPHVCTHPFAERHVRLWEWLDALTPGVRPRPRVEIWPRGGAKSSTGELGCARVGAKLARRFVLYVSETQEQADKHVQAVSTLFEAMGVERAVSKYGHSKGWRRDQLRTANGFNVSAIGLDVATRGVKLDQYRPDLICFDDIDNQNDAQKTIEKKINAITTAIIPAGSADCAVLFLQNLIHEESIVSMLADGRADFLHGREVPPVEPAVIGLTYELSPNADGANVYKITGGTPTWAGQDLATCEGQLNDWGLKAFLREAQQEVSGADGYVFNVSMIQYVDAEDVPAGGRECRAWDLAATEGGGDHTFGIKQRHVNGKVYILDARYGQWGSDNVRREVKNAAEEDDRRCVLRLPQDPGQAGKAQAEQFKSEFRGHRISIAPVTGDKATRASGFADALNKGNVYFVRAPWNFIVREALRKFREDEKDQFDDPVDALADGYNEIVNLYRPFKAFTF